MKILYHGFVLRAIDPALLPLAVIIPEQDDDARATQGAAGSQMSLMALPEHAQRYPVKVRGHAGLPGTGPSGETCGSCVHVRRRNGGARAYIKCSLTQSKWTGGSGSDVRIKDPACGKWTQKFNVEKGKV